MLAGRARTVSVSIPKCKNEHGLGILKSLAINWCSRGGHRAHGRGAKYMLLKHEMAAVRVCWVAELLGSHGRITGVVCAAAGRMGCARSGATLRNVLSPQRVARGASAVPKASSVVSPLSQMVFGTYGHARLLGRQEGSYPGIRGKIVPMRRSLDEQLSLRHLQICLPVPAMRRRGRTCRDTVDGRSGSVRAVAKMASAQVPLIVW